MPEEIARGGNHLEIPLSLSDPLLYEPWPNGAGSFMVDYDGRPLMNYYFTKQALSLVSLSLKYDSLLFDPPFGVQAELFLVSDSPETVKNVNGAG